MRSIKYAAFLFLVFALPCGAQSFKEALKTAKKDNKIVMLVVASEKCAQCNEVADKGLSDEVVKRAINASAVLVKVNKLPEEFSDPYSVFYFSDEFFGVIYLDGDKNVLTVYHGSTTLYKTYLDNLEKAIKEKDNSGEGLKQLIDDYYGKKESFLSAYKLIDQLRKSGLEPKGQIIDELVQKAPADSALSLTFLRFVERAAPEIGSVAQMYTAKNLDNYNMSWYQMTNQERIGINGRVFVKSLRKAIATKDISYMYRVASSRSGMFQSSGPQVMQRVQQETVLQYYKGIKDTTNYLRNAMFLYDNFYMTVSADSLARVDSLKRVQQLKSAELVMQKNINGPFTTQSVLFTPSGSFYASALNEAAWNTYIFTNNPQYISKALLWARRANEFVEQAEIMDTYARLLYRTNNKSAAIEWEEKAIALNKSRKFNTSEFEKVLKAMKQDAPKIDEYGSGG